MKLLNIFKGFCLVAMVLFASCTEDEFYEDNGVKEVTNISSTPAADAEFWYDASSTASASIEVAAGGKGTIGSAMIRKRINDGTWVDHAALGSLPTTLSLSLDDILSGTGSTINDISTSDVIEIAYLIDGQFLNGHTTIPIVCSTDMTVENQSSDVFNSEDGENASISFDMDVAGPGRANMQSIDIFSTYQDGTPVKIGSITDFPSTVTVNFSDVLAAHGLAIGDVDLRDVFEITYILNSAVACPSAIKMALPYQCPSKLAGTYTYTSAVNWCAGAETSGEVIWTEASPGVYTIDDFSHGGYTACYGGPAADWGTLTMSDVCNKLSFEGADSYGDTWTITVDQVAGRDLTISWANTYGESGTATLTRSDSDWPPLF